MSDFERCSTPPKMWGFMVLVATILVVATSCYIVYDMSDDAVADIPIGEPLKYNYLGNDLYFEVTGAPTDTSLYGTAKLVDPDPSDTKYLNMREVWIPEVVSHIDDSGIEHLYHVTEFNVSSFNNCWYLTTIHVPATITSIGNTSPVLPSLSKVEVDPENPSFIDIDGVLFKRCLGELTLVMFPSSRTGAYTLPEGTVMISDWAFYRSQISGAVIPDSVTVIGYRAFSSCEQLARIVLGPNITYIGDDAFTDCINMERIQFKDSFDILMDPSWFHGCVSLRQIVLPESNPRYRVVDGVVFTKSMDTLVYRPSGLGMSEYEVPNGVRTIGEYAFERSLLSIVRLPDGLMDIHRYAFFQSSIHSINVPDSLEHIGQYAFSGSKLRSMDLSRTSVEGVNIGTYSKCTDLETILLPDGLRYIATFAFLETSLREIELPIGLDIIYDDAFVECIHLTGIINGSVLHIEAGSESNGCVGLYATDIIGNAPVIEVDGFVISINNVKCTYHLISYKGASGSVEVGPIILSGIRYIPTSIGEKCFNISSTVEHVVLTDTIESMDKRSFHGCTSLVSVILPQNLEDIAEGAFEGCTSLTDVTFGTGLKHIGPYAFHMCESLDIVSLPEGLLVIDHYAFSLCTSMNGLYLPGSLVRVEFGAFNNCTSLRNVEFNNHLEGLGYNAFNGCSGMKSVTLFLDAPTISYRTFEGCRSLDTVYLNIMSDLIIISKGAFNDCSGDIRFESARIGYGLKAFADSNMTVELYGDQLKEHVGIVYLKWIPNESGDASNIGPIVAIGTIAVVLAIVTMLVIRRRTTR